MSELKKDLPESSHIQKSDNIIPLSSVLLANKVSPLDKLKKNRFTEIDISNKKISFSNTQALLCIRFLFACHKKETRDKVDQFNIGVDILTEKLNINNLLKAYMDIDKLKYVLMSTDQLILFDLMQNPKVDVDLLMNKKKNFDTLRNYLLNKNNIKNLERKEIDGLFERLNKEKDPISNKILNIYLESL